MSIRFRFTLLYNAILAVTLTIFGLALYSIQSNNTMNALKKELMRSSETLGESVLRNVAMDSNSSNQPPVQNNPPFSQDDKSNPAPPENIPPPKPFNTFSSDQAFQRIPEREIVRVLDASGNLVASPYGKKEDALPISATSLSLLTSGGEQWETVDVTDQEMLIYERSIIKDGQVKYILQVARSLTERNHSLQLLANTLFLASILTLIVAFGIGWIFSGIVLKPINRITKTAQTIGEERNFSRRVSHSGPNDEVGQLADTMNSMLSRLQAAYEQVAHSLTQQRDFVADVSHELRTPLTTLRGNLGLLVRAPALPVEEQKDIINDMVQECDRMIRLVNDLLKLAHADAGRRLKKEYVPIMPIIEESCRQIQNLDETRNIKWDCPDGLSIIGDGDALKQVFLILLDNAMKHSNGSIGVVASLADDKTQIVIQDDGKGIPKEKVERVFDRFYRADAEETQNGFGLGLPIARSLVESQSGNIRLESEPGKGCRVTLMFPTG